MHDEISAVGKRVDNLQSNILAKIQRRLLLLLLRGMQQLMMLRKPNRRAAEAYRVLVQLQRICIRLSRRLSLKPFASNVLINARMLLWPYIAWPTGIMITMIFMTCFPHWDVRQKLWATSGSAMQSNHQTETSNRTLAPSHVSRKSSYSHPSKEMICSWPPRSSRPTRIQPLSTSANSFLARNSRGSSSSGSAATSSMTRRRHCPTERSRMSLSIVNSCFAQVTDY